MRWIRGGSDVESGRQLRERERERDSTRERLEREREGSGSIPAGSLHLPACPVSVLAPAVSRFDGKRRRRKEHSRSLSLSLSLSVLGSKWSTGLTPRRVRPF